MNPDTLKLMKILQAFDGPTRIAVKMLKRRNPVGSAADEIANELDEVLGKAREALEEIRKGEKP